MTTPKPEVKTAWAQFEADMKALRDELRRHYEPAPSGSPDLQSALNKLGKAADEVFDSVGRATRDPEVRDGTRKAARSFGSALAETFRDVADEVAAALRRGAASPPRTPGQPSVLLSPPNAEAGAVAENNLLWRA